LSTESKPATGAFGQPATSTTPQPTDTKPNAFGGFTQSSLAAPTSQPAGIKAFGGFGQPSTTTLTSTTQSTDQKSAFTGFGPPAPSTATETKPSAFGFATTSSTPLGQPIDSKLPSFGAVSQLGAPTQSSTTDSKPISSFGLGKPTPPTTDAATTATSQPTSSDQAKLSPFSSQQTDKPSEQKPPGLTGFKLAGTTATDTTAPKAFGFSSAPASTSTTPKPPEPSAGTTTAAPAGFAGFKLGGGLGGISGAGTPGTSTAATSVSGGDSTSTTPGPVRKDFAGLTPSVSPAPLDGREDKKDEKLGLGGFGLKKEGSGSGATAEGEGEKKAGGFTGFGLKKDESTGNLLGGMG